MIRNIIMIIGLMYFSFDLSFTFFSKWKISLRIRNTNRPIAIETIDSWDRSLFDDLIGRNISLHRFII